MILMDNRRHKIGSAGISTGLQQQGITAAEDNTRHQRSKNGAGSAFRIVHKGGQVNIVQHNGSNGKGRNIDHAPDGQRFTDQNIHSNGQRYIDDHAQITDVDAENVLDHGTDTIESGRCETVRKNEQLIVQSTNKRNQNDDSIG